MAGVDDCYTSAPRLHRATPGNFAEATCDAVLKAYSYLTLGLWKESMFPKAQSQAPLAKAPQLHVCPKVPVSCRSSHTHSVYAKNKIKICCPSLLG